VTPLVSIVISNYNYARFLRNTLTSCINQTFHDIEVVVYDDKSTDDSRALMLEMMSIDTRIRCIFGDVNRGYSRGKNTSIKHSKSDLIVHLDADDMLTEDSIERRFNFMKAKPSVDMVCGHAYFVGMESLQSCYEAGTSLPIDREGRKRKTSEVVVTRVTGASQIHAQTVMLRRNVFDRVGLYDEDLRSKSDKEMWERMLFSKMDIRKMSVPVAYYRVHDESMSRVRTRTPSVNNQIKALFNEKVAMRKKGITRENTLFP